MLGELRSKLDPVDQPERTAHYDCAMRIRNATQYYSTETVLLIFPYLQINITVQMRPSGSKIFLQQLSNNVLLRCLDNNNDLHFVFSRSTLISKSNTQDITWNCTDWTCTHTDVVPVEPSHATTAFWVQVAVRQKLLLQQPKLAIILINHLLSTHISSDKHLTFSALHMSRCLKCGNVYRIKFHIYNVW